MTPDETRAYKRGYDAGTRRVARDRAEERRRDEAEARNRCYLALLPAAMQVDGWKIGDVQVHTSAERINLARLLADQAAKNMKGAA